MDDYFGFITSPNQHNLWLFQSPTSFPGPSPLVGGRKCPENEVVQSQDLLTVSHTILMMLVWGILFNGSIEEPIYNPQTDISLYSHHLSAWYCTDFVRRSCIRSLLKMKGLWRGILTKHWFISHFPSIHWLGFLWPGMVSHSFPKKQCKFCNLTTLDIDYIETTLTELDITRVQNYFARILLLDTCSNSAFTIIIFLSK